MNLHGNAKKRETAPDGSPDENVFDIQQGVAIGMFVKEPGKKGAGAGSITLNIWGSREKAKMDRMASTPWLFAHERCESTEWADLAPQPPFYLFVPARTSNMRGEYRAGQRVRVIADLMQTHDQVWAFETHRDGRCR